LSSAGPWIIQYGDKLYNEINRYGRQDLLNILKYEWNRWWSLTKGAELPPQCPKCGFNSLMPDYTCIVCRHVATEKEILKSYNFDLYIDNIIRKKDIDLVKKIIEKGYIIISSAGIKDPDSPKGSLDLEVHLDHKSKNRLKHIIENIDTL
jgi:hypothetical protein